MDQIPTDILLSLFKTLNPKEMVKSTRVCKRWHEIINQNQALWRTVVLPDRKMGWSIAVLKLFDRKSQSTLTEVSIRTEPLQLEKDAKSFKRTLFKSSETLQFIHIHTDEYDLLGLDLSDAKIFPNLVDFMVEPSFSNSSTHLRHSHVKKISSSLRTVWMYSPKWNPVVEKHLLDSVVSLHLGRFGMLTSKEFRSILERPALTLKDLDIMIADDREDHINQRIAELEFLQLRVLRLQTLIMQFPPWMKIPPTTTLLNFHVLSSMPSRSQLWISDFGTPSLFGWEHDPSRLQELKKRSPILSELRIEGDFKGEDILETLTSMLAERKRNVDSQIEIDGVKMICLQNLVLDFQIFNENDLSKLRDLVGDVVDLNTVARIIEVEV